MTNMKTPVSCQKQRSGLDHALKLTPANSKAHQQYRAMKTDKRL